MYEEKKQTRVSHESIHNLILEGRKKISVSAVSNVESFDDESIVLLTDMGTLTIRGNDLHINKLSVESGETVIEGSIDSCVYSESKEKQSMLMRLFK